MTVRLSPLARAAAVRATTRKNGADCDVDRDVRGRELLTPESPLVLPAPNQVHGVWRARELAALTRRIAATSERWRSLSASFVIGLWGGFFVLVWGQYARLDIMVLTTCLTVTAVAVTGSRYIAGDRGISLGFRADLYDMRADELAGLCRWPGAAAEEGHSPAV